MFPPSDNNSQAPQAPPKPVMPGLQLVMARILAVALPNILPQAAGQMGASPMGLAPQAGPPSAPPQQQQQPQPDQMIAQMLQGQQQVMAQLASSLAAIAQSQQSLAEAMKAPKRVVKDNLGNIVGTAPMLPEINPQIQ